MKYLDCICDFSLIIIVYLFLLFPKIAESFSNSIWGKALAVVLIMTYTYYDILYGLLFCLLVIIYYYHIELMPREGFGPYEYQLDTGKTDDFYAVPRDSTPVIDAPILAARDGAETKFVEQKCPNGDLIAHSRTPIGDFHVPTEMAEHIFPELAYPGPPCNPCSQQCAFKIVDKRILAEDEIMLPKNSNEWFETIVARVNGET